MLFNCLFLSHCNNPISTQCEFELNLIENDQFDEIDNNILQISNTKKKESERLADSTQKGIVFNLIYYIILY